MADMDALIGCRLSLITNQDVRYDGKLFSINQAESSIVLKDVQVLGSEDRITDPSKKVPASNVTIPFITFPGNEIKDLFVREDANTPPPAPAAAPAQAAAKPPAAPAKAAHEKKEHKPRETKPQHAKADHQKAAAAPAATTTAAAPAPAASTSATAKEDHKKKEHTAAGTGSHLLKMREKKSGTTASADEVKTSEFDFQEGLKTFKKDEVAGEVSAETKKYVKDDFFDNLTGDNNAEGRKTRMTAAEERVLNADTFGAIALQSGYRRGGRGRGGRGRGRSGGRGGRGRGSA